MCQVHSVIICNGSFKCHIYLYILPVSKGVKSENCAMMGMNLNFEVWDRNFKRNEKCNVSNEWNEI